MRISDWSSDVCSSDLDTEPAKSREGTSVLQKNWTELIKPTKLDIQPGPDAHRVAKVVAEPLERGFGLTLGNAIRRVLLSSLQGAAVTSMQVRSEEHTSELQSLMRISYAVFCLKKQLSQVPMNTRANTAI